MANQEFNKKVLITGGTGLLGKYLIENKTSDTEIVAVYIGEHEMSDGKGVRYHKADIRDKKAIQDLFERTKPDIVIHTAAVGSPDFAEKNKDLTREINVGGTQNLLYNSERFNAPFIYISSNGIYDGENAPYSEDDPARPVNVYGEIKLEAEKTVVISGLKKAIVRPILMYGWNNPFERPNIVSHSIAKLRKEEEVYVYDDVYCNPLYAQSCALSIWKIISEDKYGTYNIAGADRVSVFGLIKKAAQAFHLNEDLIHPVQEGYFNELVKRPRDTSFKTDKMIRALGCQPMPLNEGLKIMHRAEDS